MKHLTVTLVALYSFYICGCSSLARTVPDYSLVEAGDVVASNSKIIFFDFQGESNKDYRDGGLYINYPIVIKNTSVVRKSQLHLSKAVFRVNDERIPIRCLLNNKSTDIVLEQNSKTEILCKLELRPDGRNKLAMRDSRGLISIPVAGAANKAIEFPLILRIEDFR